MYLRELVKEYIVTEVYDGNQMAEMFRTADNHFTSVIKCSACKVAKDEHELKPYKEYLLWKLSLR